MRKKERKKNGIIYSCFQLGRNDGRQLFTLRQYPEVCYCSCCYSILTRRFYSRLMFSLNYCSYRKYLLIILLFSLFIYFNSVFQTPQTTHSNKPISNSIRILYAIRTNSHFYHKRLIYSLQTWIPLIRDDVFFVSNIFLPNISHDHTILTEKICGSDSHSMGVLCCKTAHDFNIFHRYLSNYDWFCHFDDDQYVNVNKLKEYLSTFDFNQPYYIGRTSWSESLKRSKEPFPYPFWFATLGAGVCLSKRTINLLKPYTENISEFVNGCIQENYHDDIYLGFILNGYLNITLTKTNRFHSHLEKSFYSNKQTFLRIFTNEITFGFRSPDRYPYYLPQLYTSQSDPYRIRTLHCFLYTEINECQTKIRQHLFNSTN
jgi:hypothetical protein